MRVLQFKIEWYSHFKLQKNQVVQVYLKQE
jgi:hypothetical protein